MDVVCVGLVGLRIAERLLQVCHGRGGRGEVRGERGERGEGRGERGEGGEGRGERGEGR